MATFVDILIVALVFFVFLFFDSINSILGNVVIFVFYSFILANLGESVTKLSLFYLILTLFNLVMSLTPFAPDINRKPMGLSFKIFQSPIPLLHLFGGIGLLVVFSFLSTNAKAQVFGIPTLATGINLLAPVTAGLSLAAIGLLGISENRTAVILTNIIEKFQPFGIVVALPAVAILMGLFHSAAYGAAGIATLIFPIIAFAIIILVIKMFKEDTAASFAHYWYNILTQVARGLIIRI